VTKQHEFDVTVKGSGVDIHRQVNGAIGARIISILVGGVDVVKEKPVGRDETTVASGGSKESPTAAGREAFFESLQNKKPSDNALAAAAFHFSQYGSSDFTIDEMRELADDVGITVPERLDMTYLAAKRNGNALFRRSGKGAFRPTVHGERFFRHTYNARKGTARNTAGADE
jgi:hypothetical protein